MADPTREQSYDPSETEVTRGREQGLGVGQRDLERQRDPGAPDEGPSFQSTVELEDPEEPASGGMQQGANHTKWEEKDKIMGQGKKTLAAHREQWKRGS
jgi:hypothetical protein